MRSVCTLDKRGLPISHVKHSQQSMVLWVDFIEWRMGET